MRPLTVTQEELAALADPVFRRGGTIQFEARGSSMRPLIRSGDLLTLEPVENGALEVGDVALYRLPAGQLVVHRLVRISGTGVDATLYFRGDAHRGDLEIVAPSWVLGRVTTFERDSRTVQLGSDRSRFVTSLWRAFAPIGAPALDLGDALRYHAARAARGLQGTPTYRRLGRRVVSGRVRYRLGTPRDTDRWNRFHRVRGAGPASQSSLSADSPLWTSDTYSMVLATTAGQILGATDLVSHPERPDLFPDWWIFGMKVGPLFRGLGIGEGIVMESLRQLRRRGAERLHLQVFPDNQRALAFYRKLGFEDASKALQEAQLEAHRSRPAHLRNMQILTRSFSA